MIKSMIKRVATIALAGAMIIGSLSVNNLQVEAKTSPENPMYASREDYWNIWDATGYTADRPAEFWVGDFGYKKLSNNTAAVTLFMGYENTALNIPATVTYEGVTYTVTRIGREDGSIYLDDSTLPNYRNNFTGLVIPNTVTEICDEAFCAMNIGGKIVIPDTVKKLGYESFKGVKATEIIIGNGVTKIPERCFCLASELTKVTIGKNVKSIGKEAFCDNKLKQVNVKSKKLKTVSKNAFSCSKEKSDGYTGVSRKITVKAPKVKMNEYKTLFTKSWKKDSVYSKANKYTFKKL